jgi:hypothetical protein
VFFTVATYSVTPPDIASTGPERSSAIAGAAGAAGGASGSVGSVLAVAVGRGAATGAGTTTGAGFTTWGGGEVVIGGADATAAGATWTHSVAPPMNRLDWSRISTRWHWRPGSSRRNSSVIRRAVPAARSIVPFCSIGVEVVDHPQLLQVAAGAVDDLHVVGHAVAHLAGQRPGDVHEHVVLAPRPARGREDHEDRRQQTADRPRPNLVRHVPSYLRRGTASPEPRGAEATMPRRGG